jgi:hypothetical protein
MTVLQWVTDSGPAHQVSGSSEHKTARISQTGNHHQHSKYIVFN